MSLQEYISKLRGAANDVEWAILTKSKKEAQGQLIKLRDMISRLDAFIVEQ